MVSPFTLVADLTLALGKVVHDYLRNPSLTTGNEAEQEALDRMRLGRTRLP